MSFWSQTTSVRYEIRPLQFPGDNTQLYVELKKLIQQLTQSPLAFINWAASRHAPSS